LTPLDSVLRAGTQCALKDRLSEEQLLTDRNAAPASAILALMREGDLTMGFLRPVLAQPVPSLPVNLPEALQLQIKDIEKWAAENRSNATRDALRFWALKLPAIAVSASSGIFAYFKMDGVAVVAGFVASLCVLLDGLYPGGALRNVHHRAFNDLRKLQNTIISDWQVGHLRDEDHKRLAANIIESAKKEKGRIDNYVTEAEASLGERSPSKSRKK